MQYPELDIPYQLLDQEGQLLGPIPADLKTEQLLHWYRVMRLTRLFSAKLVALQRQGRATTWIPSDGQEAIAVGMATSLQEQDWLACSPREMGAYLLKGVSPAAIAYFTRGYAPPTALFPAQTHCLPFTIVIGTQMPHAVGLAMAAKIKGDNAVVVGACGDGATSEGDFNEALNFAGVFQAPAVLVVVNNGWAISVPRHKQTVARWLAERGAGFGVPARLVDGNDILAVYSVMKEATERTRNGGGPTLVEAITYRLTGHSTADDPTRYQPREELAVWQAKDPLRRFRCFLMKQGWLDEAEDKKIIAAVEAEIAEQVEIAFNYPAPSPGAFFDNVYQTQPPRLQRQHKLLQQDIAQTPKTKL